MKKLLFNANNSYLMMIMFACRETVGVKMNLKSYSIAELDIKHSLAFSYL
jgi:hypothetical protein